MAVATRIPRYSKFQKILVNDKELTLIEHLQNLRTECKITKKKISNIIKQNDTWYSQIEQNNKSGNKNRQTTIYRPDLVKIISIVKYGANTISDLPNYQDKSEVYLDKIIKAIPLDESLKKIEWYEIYKNRTPVEQNNLFSSLLESITKLLQQAYDSLSIGDRNIFLDHLKNMNASLKIDSVFIVYLAGLPFSEFLYESNQEKIYLLLQNIMKTLDKLTIESNKDDHKQNDDYIRILRQQLLDYIGKSSYTLKQNFIPLPDDEVKF